MGRLSSLLEASASCHSHLCPRQVLGVRIGLAGAAALELNVPRKDKRLLVILETDGCFADGVQVATGCTVGHRTLRVEDYGKVAATFVDVHSGQAVRIAPRLAIRELANLYAPGEDRHYFAQLQAYQTMPDEQLLSTTEVSLNTAAEVFLSRPGVRVNCAMCGEEIINERQVIRNGIAYCRACVGQAYYQQTVPSLALPLLCALVGA